MARNRCIRATDRLLFAAFSGIDLPLNNHVPLATQSTWNTGMEGDLGACADVSA